MVCLLEVTYTVSMESMGQSIDDDSISDFGDEDLSETERQELEVALYCQLHHDQSEILVGNDEDDTSTMYKFNTQESDIQISEREAQKVFANTNKLNTPDNNTIYISSESCEELTTSILGQSNETTNCKSTNKSSNKRKDTKSSDVKSEEGFDSNLNFTPIDETVDSKFGSHQSKTSSNHIVIDSDNSSEFDSDVSLTEIYDDFDSDCMMLDEDVSDDEKIQLHLDPFQERLLKKRSTAEDKKWEILDEDKFGKASPVPTSRYYRGKDNSRCTNCREFGHIAKECAKPKKSEICHLCGFVGHYYLSCPEGICYNCDRPGHIARECDQKRRNLYMVCYRCKMPGHSIQNCPDNWRQFHLTVDKANPYKGDNKENPRRFCHNCAEEGHYGFECQEERFDRHSLPIYTLIAQYNLKERFQLRKSGPTKRKIDEDVSCERDQTKKAKKSKLTKDINDNKNFQVAVNLSGGTSKRRVSYTGPESDMKSQKNAKKRKKEKKSRIGNEDLVKTKNSERLENKDTHKSSKFLKNSKEKTKMKENLNYKKKGSSFQTKKSHADEDFPRTMKNSKTTTTFVRTFPTEDSDNSNLNHQVFHNEYWNEPDIKQGSSSKKKSKKKKKKTKTPNRDLSASSRGFYSKFRKPI